MHAHAHTRAVKRTPHLRFVIEGMIQQFEPLQPVFWDSWDFNWILHDLTQIPFPNVHMNQPSSFFFWFQDNFISSILSVNFCKYCHIIIPLSLVFGLIFTLSPTWKSLNSSMGFPLRNVFNSQQLLALGLVSSNPALRPLFWTWWADLKQNGLTKRIKVT